MAQAADQASTNGTTILDRGRVRLHRDRHGREQVVIWIDRDLLAAYFNAKAAYERLPA